MATLLIPILDAGTRRLAAGQLPIAEVGEISRDAVAAALRTSGPANITVDDVADTITVNITATVNATDAALRDRATHTGTQAASTIGDLTETVQDIVGSMMASGANVTLAYDDTAGTLTVTGAAGGDAELMRDTIGAALVGTNGVTVTVNDAADTIVLSITGLTIAQVSGLQAALDAKASVSHTHTVSQITATGTPSATTYLRGDGTWATPAGGGTVSDASSTVKGIVQLTNHFGGTAAAPTVVNATFATSPTTPDVAAGDSSSKVVNSKFVAAAITASKPPAPEAYVNAQQDFTTATLADITNLSIDLAVGTYDVNGLIKVQGGNADDGKLKINFSGTAGWHGKTDSVPGTGSNNSSWTSASSSTTYGGTQNVISILANGATIPVGCGDDGLATPTPFQHYVMFSMKLVVTVAGTLTIQASKNTNTTSVAFSVLPGTELTAVKRGS